MQEKLNTGKLWEIKELQRIWRQLFIESLDCKVGPWHSLRKLGFQEGSIPRDYESGPLCLNCTNSAYAKHLLFF